MPERTLFRQDQVVRDGKRYRQFTTGPIAGTSYRVHGDGSVRHAIAQFKGSKKDRKRFAAAIRTALANPIPDGFEELQPDQELRQEPTLDIVYDVAEGKWVTTPYIKCTLTQLQAQFGTFVRSARVKVVQPSTPTDSSSPSTVATSP